MAENGRPRKGDDRLISALAGGATIRDAAKSAGIGERTAHRRLADPTFRVRVAHTRHKMLDETVGRIAAAGSQAADTLRDLLTSPDESIRLRAAVALLKPACQMDASERDRLQYAVTADQFKAYGQQLRDAIVDVTDTEAFERIAERYNELAVRLS